MAEKKAARPRKAAPKASTEVNGAPDQWTALRAEFAYWLIDGTRQHYRGEQRDWAQSHGVTEETLSRWRTHPEVLGITSTWKERLSGDFGRGSARLMSIVLYGRPLEAVAAYGQLAKTMGANAPDKHEISGRMTLADFLAKGGYSQDEEQRARVN